MLQFYTGGLDNHTPTLSQSSITMICNVLKSHYYEKCIKMSLDNYDINKCSIYSGRTQKSSMYTIKAIN